MKSRRGILSGVLTLVLVVLAAWAMGFFRQTDPAIAELQQIGSQMRDTNLPDAQRNQLRSDFRQRIGSLTDDQRRAFFASNRDQWNKRAQERMDEYFRLSKADQRKRLDEILNRMAQGQNSQQPNANGQSNRGAGNNRGGGRNMTDAQRQERSKHRLDQTTPKMRAQFAEFRKQLDQRAQERGMQVGNGQGFGGFGRGA